MTSESEAPDLDHQQSRAAELVSNNFCLRDVCMKRCPTHLVYAAVNVSCSPSLA